MTANSGIQQWSFPPNLFCVMLNSRQIRRWFRILFSLRLSLSLCLGCTVSCSTSSTSISSQKAAAKVREFNPSLPFGLHRDRVQNARDQAEFDS